MVPLRDLSWQLFTLTGSVDAYLLFKDLERLQLSQGEDEPDSDQGRAVAKGPIH